MSEFPIPMGFRFDPSDEELIKYLRLQGNGDPLPWNGIIYKDLYGPNAAPWVVFSGGAHCYWHNKTEGGATNSTTFVFTKLIRFANSRRISRTSGGGTWSAQSSPKKIFSSETSEIVGFMRMLSFKNPDSGGGSLDFGHWIMHEYYLSNKTAAAAAAADDLVVCRITRSDKNLGRSHPQPQLFSPMSSDGGRSAECKHDPTNKRAAEECYAQECKAQKLFGDGFAAEAPPHLFSPRTAHVKDVSWEEEKPGGGDGGGSSFPDDEEVDDSWLVDALEQDENIEPPYGGSNTAVAEDDSWRESLHQNIDNMVKSWGISPQEAAEAEAAADPLQVSALSPYEYDFSFATECLFDDVLDLEPLWP